MKLQGKLILWIFGLGLISIAILTSLSIIQTNQTENNVRSELIKNRLIYLQVRITDWLETMNNQIKLIDKNIILKNIIINKLGGEPSVNFNTIENFSRNEYIIDYFNHIIRESGRSISEFFILNRNGKVSITTNTKSYPIGKSFANKMFFRFYQDDDAGEKGSSSSIFGPLYHYQIDKSKEGTSFALTSKVVDKNNKFVGVIVAFTDSQKLNKIIKYEIQEGEENLPFITYLFDEKERALDYPVIKDSISLIPDFISMKIVIKDTNQVVKPVIDAINTPFKKKDDRKQLPYTYKNFEDRIVVGGWFWINLTTTRFGGIVELPIDFLRTSVLYWRNTVFIIAGVGILSLFTLVAVIISKLVVRPMVKATEYLSIIAEGHIPKEVESNRKDEVGDLIKTIGKLTGILRSMISKTKSTSSEIIKSSKLIIVENEDLAQRTERASELFEKTVSSMEQMTSFIKENANNVNEANIKARKTINVAETGKDKVIKTMESINNIDNFSKKISQIIAVMDNVAFQTNLLSLNAAVESARSGEHGKGFSVLSAEIRSLAQRSKKAAKQISELIHTTNEKVDEAVELGNESTKVFYNILREMGNLSKLIAEVTKRSRDQEIGIESITKSIINMDALTQKNAQLVENVNLHNKIMLNGAEALTSAVQYFKVEDGYSEETQLGLPEEEDYEIPFEETKNNHITLEKEKEKGKEEEEEKELAKDIKLLFEDDEDKIEIDGVETTKNDYNNEDNHDNEDGLIIDDDVVIQSIDDREINK